AEERGIKGKDITPFLLDKIQKITGGNSLASNIQLVLNNARLASQIAIELSKLA
ncbi:MAG: pseudouridine-5'-phosphate glycosidase, partial [Clostridia bacterium]|nr:pseudouridine-5'-phosphate glycosidase [Clostridia bacterium]